MGPWEFGFDVPPQLGARYVLDPNILVFYKLPFDGKMYYAQLSPSGNFTYESGVWQLVLPGTEWEILEVWAGPDQPA